MVVIVENAHQTASPKLANARSVVGSISQTKEPPMMTNPMEVAGVGPAYIDGMALSQVAWKRGTDECLRPDAAGHAHSNRHNAEQGLSRWPSGEPGERTEERLELLRRNVAAHYKPSGGNHACVHDAPPPFFFVGGRPYPADGIGLRIGREPLVHHGRAGRLWSGGGLEGTGISDQLGGAHGVIKRRLRSRKNLTLGEAGRRFQGLEVFRRLPDLQVRDGTHAGGRCRYPFPLVGGQPAQPVEEGLDLNGVGPEPLVAHVT